MSSGAETLLAQRRRCWAAGILLFLCGLFINRVTRACQGTRAYVKPCFIGLGEVLAGAGRLADPGPPVVVAPRVVGSAWGAVQARAHLGRRAVQGMPSQVARVLRRRGR